MIVALIPLFFALGFAPAPREPPARGAPCATADECFHRGAGAMADGRWDEAARRFQRASDLDPMEARYRFMLARALDRLGRAAEARRLLVAVVTDQPRYRDAATELARLRARDGDFAGVIRVLKPFDAEDADDQPVYNTTGPGVAPASHPPEHGLEAGATHSSAGCYDVLRLLGEAYLQTGDVDAARRCLVRAIDLNPRVGDNLALLGECYLRGGKYALAAEAFERALRCRDQGPEIHFKAALALHRRGRDIGPTTVVKAPDATAGTLTTDHLLLEPVAGQPGAFRACGWGSALFHIRKALAGGPPTVEATRLLGDISLSAGRYEDARAALAEVVERFTGWKPVPPDQRAAVLGDLARACLALDDRDAYLEYMRAAATADRATFGPQLFEAYHRVARRCAADGDRTGCIDALTLAAAQRPADVDTRYQLGNALWEEGRRDEAVHQWRITLELDPRHPDRQRLLETIRAARAGGRP